MVLCAKAVPVGAQTTPPTVTVPAVPKLEPEIVITAPPCVLSVAGEMPVIWGAS